MSMNNDKPLVGILQCGEKPAEMDDALGDYDALFRTLLGEDAFRYRTWRALDGELPCGVDEADAWLLTGSRYAAYEPHAWIPPLEQFIRVVHAAGVPMLGICFGHQLIAQALGGRVEKFQGGWSIGRVDYRFEAPSSIPAAVASLSNEAVPLMAWHQDQIVEAPAGAVTVASSDFCRHAALVYGERTFTVQPHPEFGPDFVGGLLETRGKAVPEPLRDRAAATIDQPLARDRVAQAMRRFVIDALASRNSSCSPAPEGDRPEASA